VCEYQKRICDNGNCTEEFGNLLTANFNFKEKQNVIVRKIETSVKGEKFVCKGGTKSFITFQKNNTALLLYNCNKNFTIHINGSATMKAMLDDATYADLAFMKYSFRMNKEDMLVLTYSKKTEHRFAKFSFKE